MYSFVEETDLEKFDSFVEQHKGSYLQCSAWTRVKTAWSPKYYSCYMDDEMIMTALVLERTMPVAGKLWYISCGPVCDDTYKYDEKFQADFANFLKSEMRKYHIFCTVTDPFIPLRINGEEQENGKKANKILTSAGYKLNPQISTYTYKHPVQTMIPLKDSDGTEIPAEKILKGCEKGVRYSVRVGTSRGLTSARYKSEDIEKDPSIIDEFMTVMGDTSDRNSFVSRDAQYCGNLIKNLKEYTDITVVYYDKSLDKKLEDERLAKKEQLLADLETAPQKKIKGLQSEIEVIDSNTESYKQRVAETSDYPDDARIAVAAGLTIRYGGIASCIFGGTRNIVRNNTRSSHYLNYLRLCESIDENMDYHDLGYVLVKDPELTPDGLLGPMEPLDNFKGICDFKKSFSAEYFEFIGEYILVGNKAKYLIYKELIPKAKHWRMQLIMAVDKIKKKD